jgi:hypothetical protein
MGTTRVSVPNFSTRRRFEKNENLAERLHRPRIQRFWEPVFADFTSHITPTDRRLYLFLPAGVGPVHSTHIDTNRYYYTAEDRKASSGRGSLTSRSSLRSIENRNPLTTTGQFGTTTAPEVTTVLTSHYYTVIRAVV